MRRIKAENFPTLQRRINQQYWDLNGYVIFTVLSCCSRSEALTRSREFVQAVNTYSNSWHRAFSPLLLASLPRELRDLVYGFLIGQPESPVDIVPPDEMEVPTLSDMPGPLQFPISEQHVLPILSVNIMGIQFVSEIAEVFYARVQLTIHRATDLGPILHQGPLDSAVLCAPSDYIRRLEVWITETDDVYKMAEDASRTAKDIYPMVANTLQPIRRLKHLKGLKIHLVACSDLSSVAQKLLDAVVPELYQMRAAGFKISARHRNPWYRDHIEFKLEAAFYR